MKVELIAVALKGNRSYGIGLQSLSVGPMPPDSLPAMVADSGARFALVGLSALPENGPVATWMSEPRLLREFGAVYNDNLDSIWTVLCLAHRKQNALWRSSP